MRAHAVLAGHTALKREIKNGGSVENALYDPRAVGQITLGQILTAQHGWAGTTMRRFLARIGAPDTAEVKRIDAMTRRQKEAVIAGLRDPNLVGGWKF